MTNRQTTWALTLMLLTIVAAVLLSASLSELNFLPGGVYALPRAGGGGGGGLSGWLDQNLADLSGLISLIMVILLPISIILLIVSPEARKLFKQYMLMVSPLLILALFFLARRSGGATGASDEGAPIAAGESTAETPLPPTVLENPPDWLVNLTSFLIIFGILLIGWYLYNRFLRPSPLEQLAHEAQEAIDDLQAGADLSDTIKRCYFDMSRVLRKQRGIRRKQGMTAREFEQHLKKTTGLPFTHIQQLTRLFESVRYGTRSPDAAQENMAVECLKAIVHAAENPIQVELA